MIELKQRKLVTIVIESALENRLLKDIVGLGISGYTVTGSHGLGPKNQRNGDLEGGNSKVEIVTREMLLDSIIELLSSNYLPHYACSFWVSDVQVLRDERY